MLLENGDFDEKSKCGGISNGYSLDCDVVVVGGGGLGLVAAVRAAEAGVKKIVVIEKTSKPGGNTMLAIGMMGADTQTQKKCGFEVSPDTIFKMSMESAEWALDPVIVRTFINNTKVLMDWLADKGLEFKVLPSTHNFGVQGVYHQVIKKHSGNKEAWPGPGFVGSYVVEKMLEECKKHNIEIMTSTKATKILLNDAGKASGILAEADDTKIQINAPCVIISAGCFSANKDMLKKYFPQFFTLDNNITRLSKAASTGDGILMAEEIGAKVGENMGVLLFGPAHHPGKFSVYSLSHQPYCMCVNKKGKRFYDEAIGFRAQNAMSRDYDNTIVYSILDEDTKNYFYETVETDGFLKENAEFNRRLDEDLKTEDAAGKLAKIGNTLDEIAYFLGVEPDVLKATVEQYNRYCDNGRDEDFVKDKQFLRPIRQAPYYAIVGYRCFDTTHGGIMVNENLEVLDSERKGISGLFATGDNCSGWVSQNYTVPGTSLAWCFNSGYMAGENASKYIHTFVKCGNQV